MSGEGGDPIALVTAALASIMDGLTPPSDATKAPVIYDDLITDPNLYPAICIVPREIAPTVHASSTLSYRLRIDVIMLFSLGDLKYASRAERAWVPVVLTKIHTTLAGLRLNDTCQNAHVQRVNFDPVMIGDVPMPSITFEISAITTEPYTVT